MLCGTGHRHMAVIRFLTRCSAPAIRRSGSRAGSGIELEFLERGHIPRQRLLKQVRLGSFCEARLFGKEPGAVDAISLFSPLARHLAQAAQSSWRPCPRFQGIGGLVQFPGA